jgi:hypothetical protein
MLMPGGGRAAPCNHIGAGADSVKLSMSERGAEAQTVASCVEGGMSLMNGWHVHLH